MTILESIIIAIVEGLTEFLPVSSTGHMILAEGLMRMENTEYLRAFTVMIQFGAILSVVMLYLERFLPWRNQPIGGNYGLSGWSLYGLMIIGCIPAGVLGLLLEEYIDQLLGNLWVVIAMLFVGGLVMIYMDRRFTNKTPRTVTPRRAFTVGLFQCLAMIPGVSRSMATIFGGMQQGLTRRQAAEFSFFLAIPTMFGATLLKAYKLYKSSGIDVFSENWQTLLIGNVVAFLVALAAIKLFIGIVTKYGFRVFGYYRIVIAIVFAILMLMGVPIHLS
ncbi:undecaprenyl-diphosphate phosphatase [Porphyromonas sp. COT-290 OH3588]|uniref:undecaprenyl-diphosphate phosphatase n=1 Tax=Porphyromonas sp. COT-290 OH3588 TaxID=1515617 RepID=UPI00052D7B1F|nr:undecaprenyl-diphosphate phosphatase [Porphyromonas sp. COT-290 OH3588]KGO00147.1 UDP-diphosphatase [Porphyromonas sp. COT-290 OH3588]